MVLTLSVEVLCCGVDTKCCVVVLTLSVVCGVVVAAAIKELRAQVLNFMASMVRHYTMVAIAQQCGPFPLCSEKQSRLQVMDAHVLIDALAVIMGHEEKELCKPGQFALMLILEAATTILGSRDRVSEGASNQAPPSGSTFSPSTPPGILMGCCCNHQCSFTPD